MGWEDAFSAIVETQKIVGEDLYDWDAAKLENLKIPAGVANRIMKLVPNHPSRATAPAPQPGKPPLLPLYFSGRDVGDELIFIFR